MFLINLPTLDLIDARCNLVWIYVHWMIMAMIGVDYA